MKANTKVNQGNRIPCKVNKSLINKAKFFLFTVLMTAAIVSVPQKAYSWGCNSKCEWYQPDCYAYREYCYYVANICSNTLKVADSQVQSSNGPNLTTLTQYQKSVLRPFLGNLVDQVFLRYNAILAAEYSIDGKPFHRGYGGQTFGNRIYIINPLDEQRVDQLGIIAHEMKHVEQFSRVGDWTRDYCKKWIDADFSYNNNQWEIEARAFEGRFENAIQNNPPVPQPVTSAYSRFRLQTGTALHETGDNFAFAVLPNGDVVAIKKSQTGSNSTEIYSVLSKDEIIRMLI